jgi:hypothetical protein
MGRRVIVAVAAAVMLVACYEDPPLPRTPEAMKCARDCMHMQNECRATCAPASNLGCLIGCKHQRSDCMSTCPGGGEGEGEGE